MKFLLTSAGIANDSIGEALVRLLGKPISEATALIIPTAIYSFPEGGRMAWQAISGAAPNPLCGLGWKSLGVLELTALPSIRKENWEPMVRNVDALLVWGGDVLYLCHWMRRSGLADILPDLDRTLYVGMSAGSIAMTPHNCDAEFDLGFVPEDSDRGGEAERGIGLVDVALYPHFGNPDMEDTSAANIGRWAAGIPVPTYAIDDQTALVVEDGTVEVVSEGSWQFFTP
ncbi:Type 1 glutamine amidotransferase-like domain-containing protein [Arthrobacter sp. JSM 101049]|uniref:Type 1 glutamine amidotransferase-like domain-containing protein n=1 Tax=Arthrobacter sp. JSM 101049 TaxID=929097 RepID=UPI00356B0BE3